MSAIRADAGRIFVTALLVYVAFWNPWLQFSNSDNFVDAAVSLVDTGRWELAHWRRYEGKDTATARDGRVVPGVPFGTALVIVPVYAAWRGTGGPAVEGWAGLEDRSSRPKSCPHQTPRAVERQIERLRRRHKLGSVGRPR